MNKLLKRYIKNELELKNHIVMAPMTRSRAIGNVPNELMAEYYEQRSGAGLIITEGTAPNADALGYPRIPGIFTAEQVEGWKKTTSAVHAKGSKIFLQLMHTGRIGHADNLPEGASIRGASNIKAAGQIFTDTKGLQDHAEPVALSTGEIEQITDDFVSSAHNAMLADFDGIEIHAANGYLPEQFLNPNVNNREDAYGGSVINRARFILEIVEKTVAAIGNKRVGVRVSPFSENGDLQPYSADEVKETYTYLAEEFNRLNIAYIHISANTNGSQQTYEAIRAAFKGTIIFCNGLTPQTGEAALHQGIADLVAFGRSFLANPDFVTRIETGAALNPVDFTTLYTAGSGGYTDYTSLPRPTTVITVDPDQGEHLSVVGDNYRILISGKETDDAFAVIDMMIPPGGGPMPHAHGTFQESFYVIEGEIVVRSEESTYIARPGAFVSIPKGGAIHSFRNESKEMAHILCMVAASGLEEFFEEVGIPVKQGEFLPAPVLDEESADRLHKLAAKYQQEVFAPDYFNHK